MITDAEVIYQNQYFTFESNVKINKEEDKQNIDNNFVPPAVPTMTVIDDRKYLLLVVVRIISVII